MGHKVHPNGFRLGIIHDWQRKWYADKELHDLLHEDICDPRARSSTPAARRRHARASRSSATRTR